VDWVGVGVEQLGAAPETGADRGDQIGVAAL
jgi:hypothetical protein